MNHYEVTAAILIENKEILCMQRGKGKYDYISYKYEFPGGKVESGENLEQALSRELEEEMGINLSIQPEQFFLTVNYQYPDFLISLHSYLCTVSTRDFTRKEHIAHVWVKPNQLDTLDWAPADLPIVKKLMERYR